MEINSLVPDEKCVRIYGLVDPRTNELRYVGKTNVSLKERFHGHIASGKKGSKRKTHCSFWIASILKENLLPEIFEIEKASLSSWAEAERFWISYFAVIGCRLTNISAGGDSYTYIPTKEQREKASQKTKEHMKDASRRDFLRKAAIKQWQNPEFRERMKPLYKKIRNDPDFIKNMKERKRLLWKNPEYRANQAKINRVEMGKEKWKDPEFREKMRIVRETFWTEEQRKIQAERTRSRYLNLKGKN